LRQELHFFLSVWNQTACIKATVAEQLGFFGSAVDLYENTYAIGATHATFLSSYKLASRETPKIVIYGLPFIQNQIDHLNSAEVPLKAQNQIRAQNPIQALIQILVHQIQVQIQAQRMTAPH
jgi:hypothetical protein